MSGTLGQPNLSGLRATNTTNAPRPPAPPLTPAEQATVARFEAAQYPAEVAVEGVRIEVHDWPAADFWHRDAILRALGYQR